MSGASSQGLAAERYSSKIIWLLTEFTCLQIVGLRASVSCGLSVGGCPQFLSKWISPQGRSQHSNLPHQRQQEKESAIKMKLQFFVTELQKLHPIIFPVFCQLEQITGPTHTLRFLKSLTTWRQRSVGATPGITSLCLLYCAQ